MLTIVEQEACAHQLGNTALASALGAQLDAEFALAAALDAQLDAEDQIAHLKRILIDALANDCWRERAAAAIED